MTALNLTCKIMVTVTIHASFTILVSFYVHYSTTVRVRNWRLFSGPFMELMVSSPHITVKLFRNLCLLLPLCVSFSLQNFFLIRPRIKDEGQVTQLFISAPHHYIWECEVEFHAVLTSTLDSWRGKVSFTPQLYFLPRHRKPSAPTE